MNATSSRITRRQAISRAAGVLGGIVSAPVVSCVLAGCSAEPLPDWEPATLDHHQDALVQAVANLIIPETDTPGARAARVNEFVDRMLTDWYAAEIRDHFLESLNQLDTRSQSRYENGFLDLAYQEQTSLLRESAGEAPVSEDIPSFFSMIKELTVVGYYTSEIGATIELQYVAVPAQYDPCVPFEQIGRTWS